MEQLLRILEELHPEVDFKTSKSLIDDKILDSFDIITLIAEINEEFDVRIPVDEIVPENFNSAESLYRLIQKLQDED
ncbi:MAG: acyl carrier protein [Clostridiaceae bacterium]|jgi:acyl carrier protein|nr:acyl carrier protein [Clostridiaceae bacterium]